MPGQERKQQMEQQRQKEHDMFGKYQKFNMSQAMSKCWEVLGEACKEMYEKYHKGPFGP